MSLNLTELLITGYDGDEAVLAISLGPENATVALTSADGNGDTVVDASWIK